MLIQEFIKALNSEIQSIRHGHGSSIKIFNGKLICKTSDFFIYKFHLENFLASLEDAPARITINGNQSDCQILSVNGLEFEIGISTYSGQTIPEARLTTDLSYIYELLKTKFQKVLDHELDVDFSLSESLFNNQFNNEGPTKGTCESCGKTVLLNNDMYSLCKRCGKPLLNYLSDSTPPNSYQEKAISSCVQSRLSIIWGPPGTGKTQTIAKAIEAHIRLGRKVLLVSHANNAVDEALEKVARQMRASTFYHEGKLVRLGTPQAEHYQKLESQFPMVLPAKIIEELALPLLKEKEKLELQISEAKEHLALIEKYLSKIEDIKIKKAQIIQLQHDHQKLKTDWFRIKKELDAMALRKQEIIKIIKKNQQSGAFIKALKRVNLPQLQKESDFLEVQNQHKAKALNKIETQSSQARDRFDLKRQELKQNEETLRTEFRKMRIYPNKLQSQHDEFSEKLDQWLTRTAEIEAHISEMGKRILNEARLLATTLTKTFCSNQFPATIFDVVILDEASMAPLPHFYWALGKCSQSLCIVGDFLQLPPICHSNSSIAKKWLRQSIYSLLDINDVETASSDQKINLLKRQYRMVPEISAIPNKFFYQEKLEDDSTTQNRNIHSELFKNPLVMINTSETNPWCSKLSAGSRFNLHHAILSASLARQLLSSQEVDRVGIITPYKAHAKLIKKICNDWGIINSVKVSTVYRFQGGEESTIIFDTTEGQGLLVAPFINDMVDQNAKLQLNVALTRPKNRLILISHNQHIHNCLPTRSALRGILNYFDDHAEKRQSSEFTEGYSTEQFENYASQLLGPVLTDHELEGTVFNETNFWPRFYNDLRGVNKKLIILSPFITTNRAGRFMDLFKAKVEKGIEIRIYTKPSGQLRGHMQNQHREIVDSLLQNGIKVFEISKMHQKLAILDNSISWEGSLNILSHNDAVEHMRRIESESAVEELIKNLELAEDYPVGFHTREKCPRDDCNGYLILNRNRSTGQKFLSCSNFRNRPNCNYTRRLF